MPADASIRTHRNTPQHRHQHGQAAWHPAWLPAVAQATIVSIIRWTSSAAMRDDGALSIPGRRSFH
jgi:hypothetical protein